MKRSLSLFLSIVLVFTMMSGAIVVEASSGSEDVKLVKAIDTTGRNFNDYKSEITDDIWDYSYINQSGSENDLTAMNLTYTREDKQSAMRIVVSPIGEKATSGIHTVSYKILADNDTNSDGFVDFASSNIVVNRVGSGSSGWDGRFYFPDLKVNRWYEFNIVFDLDAQTPHSVMELKDVASDAVVASDSYNVKNTNGYTNMWMYLTYVADTQANLFVKDIVHTSYYGETKAKITSVGSDGTGVLPHSQNKVKFTLNKELPGLTKDHVLVKSRQGGTDITASEITVTSDATAPSDKQWIVEATLSQDLAAWSEYDIAVSKDYYVGYKEVSNTGYVPVTDITKEFSTPSAPLDIRAPQFSNDGSATTDIISTIGNTDMTLVYTNTASEGYVKEVKSESISVNGALNGKTINFDGSFVSGDTAKLFIIKGWNNPVPLFNKSWAQSYDGTVPEADAAVASTIASSGEMVLGSFDYTDKEMTIDLNAGSDAADTNGVLYIYKRGTTMKDNLIYADYVTTANDGSLKKTIVFPDDINDVTAEYTVAFYAENVGLSKDFAIYDDEAAFGGNIVRASFDAKDRKYEDYYLEITESLISGSLGVGHTSTSFDENAMNFKFTRSDKESSYRIQVYPGNGKQTTGIHTFKYKFYADKAKADGKIDWKGGSATIAANRVASDNIDGSYNITDLKANTWYEIEFVYDIDNTKKSYLTVTDIATGEVVIDESIAIKGTNGFTNMWMYTTYTTDTTVSNNLLWKDLQVMADFGEQKAAIRYVGNNDVVDYGQNVVEFKISKNNGLTKDNIFVTDNQGNVIKAESIAVTEDMGEYIITASLERDLSSYKTYTINVDAVGYEDYREVVNGEFVAVLPISRRFTTPAAPVDIKDPEITSDGSNVTFTADILNSTSSSVDAATILAVVSSDGIMQSVTADPDTVTSVKSFTNTNAFADGNTAEYFVIKGFANPVPLFNKTWSVNYDGTVPQPEAADATDKAGSKAIVFDEYEYNTGFDHADKKVVVNLNTGVNAYVEGVLYIYSGDTLDANSVIYANYVTTAADGTLLKEIKFDSSIVNTTKEYTVAFYSDSVDGAITKTFNVYNSADYLNYKRNNILDNVKNASTFSGVKQAITGTDDLGNVVCDAWDIFSADTNVTAYNALKDKEAVFIGLANAAGKLADYNALCREFENLSIAQKNTESNPRPVGPSSNNKNPGSSSVNMSATPSKPSDNGSTVSGASSFKDMTGHWGQKYAEALVERGVVNGYEDGTFRGDNPITRAELIKIIVDALEVPAKADKTFGDVAQSSWYADYVSRAATAGVVNGFEDGSFGPGKNVTRQDAVLMIYRAMNLNHKLPEGYKFFADESDIKDYASPAIRCLGDLGIITGAEKNKFMPQKNITRAEMAAVVCRALDYIESHIQ